MLIAMGRVCVEVGGSLCRLIGIIFHTFQMRCCFVIDQFVIKGNCHMFTMEIGHHEKTEN